MAPPVGSTPLFKGRTFAIVKSVGTLGWTALLSRHAEAFHSGGIPTVCLGIVARDVAVVGAAVVASRASLAPRSGVANVFTRGTSHRATSGFRIADIGVSCFVVAHRLVHVALRRALGVLAPRHWRLAIHGLRALELAIRAGHRATFVVGGAELIARHLIIAERLSLVVAVDGACSSLAPEVGRPFRRMGHALASSFAFRACNWAAHIDGSSYAGHCVSKADMAKMQDQT